VVRIVQYLKLVLVFACAFVSAAVVVQLGISAISSIL